MRVIRHLHINGPAYASPLPDGRFVAIDGDPLSGTHRLTDRIVVPGKVLAPVVPPNILAIGLNYRKHAEEGGKGVPERPMLFMKTTTSVQNPGDPIIIPPTEPATTEIDFEAELAVVIGRTCKDVSVDDALSFVLGYTCANDVSARDWQSRWGGGQFCQAKSFDTFCPLGPALVTADEIGDPQSLTIRTILNGVVMQDWTTADMVFGVAELISFLSRGRTLLPGTVILTGTPHGVGFARKPPVFLKAGDVVTIEIEHIGSLTNPVLSTDD